MTFQTPEWLNKEFIIKTLEHDKEYSVTVENLKIEKPIAKGNNFMCDIFKATIDYRKSNDSGNLQKLSLFVKSLIKGPLTEMLYNMGVVQKEVNMYKEFSPRFKSIVGTYGDYDILTETYYSSDEDVLIMEDLSFKGYFMVEKQKQLDYDHCIIALKSLAKFHAVSVIIHEKEPELIEKLGKEVFLLDEMKSSNELMIKPHFSTAAFACKIWPGMDKYSKWFEEFSEKAWDKLADSVRRKENELSVLNHGDFWLANMMFKYDENNKPSKIKLIDLQLSRYTSPAIDILYFMYGSVQEDVRTKYFNEFISTYAKELNRNLEQYGSSKRIDVSELKKSIAERSIFGLFTSITMLGLVLCDPSKVELPDMSSISMEQLQNFTPETSPFAELLQNKQYIEIMAKRLEEFEKDGLIKAE